MISLKMNYIDLFNFRISKTQMYSFPFYQSSVLKGATGMPAKPKILIWYGPLASGVL